MLKQSFYNKATLNVAKDLLGKYLVNKIDGITYVGRIVETEAYLRDDPASHAFNGKSKRNESMFMGSGTSYVYLIYGMYNCFNVVTAKAGIGEAVLIRAVEPVEGIVNMKKNRGIDNVYNLCNGPGKLCKAMKISKSLDKHSLLSNSFYIESRKGDAFEIVAKSRIGITKGKELNYRFYIKGNKFISKK